MKIKELRVLHDRELDVRVVELRRDILKLQSQVAKGAAPKNVGIIKRAKHTVAQILTILNERRKQSKK